MKKKKLWWSICLTISCWAASSPTAHTQSLTTTIAIGDSLFVHGEYSHALYYFQRARFFASKKERYAIARKMAFAYIATQQYKSALEYFDFAINSAPSDSLQWEILFEKTALLLLNAEYKAAYAELLSLPESIPSKYWESRRNYYLGTACLGMEAWGEAEKYFVDILPESDTIGKAQIHHLFKQRRHKNVQVAKWMSILLPGSGQIYAGDVPAGINSFLLTGTIATVGIIMSLEYGWSGSLWTVNWFLRYYKGGIRSAQKAAERRNVFFNQKILKQINNKI